MSAEVLQYKGVVAVCFGCGAEKNSVFGACISCSAKPKQEDEIVDSLVLSRFTSTELLLSQAVAERSPGLVIKAADRSVMRDVANALRDPQLRQLLSLPIESRRLTANTENSHSDRLERLVQFAHSEFPDGEYQSLESCLASVDQLSCWAKNEQLLLALRAESSTVSTGVLLETIEEIAQSSRETDEADLNRYVALFERDAQGLSQEDGRELWADYERSLVDRIVVSLERVSTENLISLFERLQISTDRRRDKQPLPLVKALMAVYQSHAIETLRTEGANAARLISAVRTSDSDEPGVGASLVRELEILLANWRKVATPLSGANADREVSGIRRELQHALEQLAEHLVVNQQDIRLSEQVSRLALELL